MSNNVDAVIAILRIALREAEKGGSPTLESQGLKQVDQLIARSLDGTLVAIKLARRF